MDDDMYDDSSSGYSYAHYYTSFPARSPPPTPPRPEPVTGYDIRYLPSDSERMGKCM